MRLLPASARLLLPDQTQPQERQYLCDCARGPAAPGSRTQTREMSGFRAFRDCRRQLRDPCAATDAGGLVGVPIGEVLPLHATAQLSSLPSPTWSRGWV